MTENRSSGVSLFELLAREWTLDSEIVQAEFNSDDTAVLFRLSSGKLALVSTNDTESPKGRTRVEIDTGRTTIQQRKNPVAAAKFAPIKAHAKSPVVRFGSAGFMALDNSGVPHQITARGQSVSKFKTVDSKITALCSNQAGNTLAIAQTNSVTLYSAMDMQVLNEFSLNRQISCMSISNSNNMLAAWGEDCLTLIDIVNTTNPQIEIQGISNVIQLTWDKSENHLACASSSNFFFIVDLLTSKSHQVQNYPSQVTNAMFSEKGQALVTSGALSNNGMVCKRSATEKPPWNTISDRQTRTNCYQGNCRASPA